MRIVKIIIQLVLGFVLGYAFTLTVELTNSTEVFIFGFGNALGIFGGGAIVDDILSNMKIFTLVFQFIITLAGAFLGAGIVLLISAEGFYDDYFFPLVFAIAAYYLYKLLDSDYRKRSKELGI